MKLKTTHAFNRTGLILLGGTLAVFILLFNLKSLPNVWENIPILSSPVINDHLSNFGLSCMFIVAMSLSLLNYTKRIGYFILGSSVFMIALNFYVELYVTLENTKDTVDAWAGLIGVVLGVCVLYSVHKFGLSKTVGNK